MDIVSQSNQHVHYKQETISASATSASDSIDASSFNNGGYQIIWAGMTGTATYEIQQSLNGTNWDTVSGTSATTSGASGSASATFTDTIPGGLLRFKITSAAAAGSVNFHIIVKRG